MTVGKRRYNMTARADKAQQTRERIRNAAAGLYIERPIEDFTLEDIARRANTTVQTVLRAFGSKEELMLAALTALAQSGTLLKPTPPGDARAAVRAHYDIYETVGDVVIARLSDERRIPALKATLDQGRESHRDWVAKVFAPQLRERPELLEMLDVLTDVYIWKLLRRDRGLDRATAESIVLNMINALLKEAPDGKTALA